MVQLLSALTALLDKVRDLWVPIDTTLDATQGSVGQVQFTHAGGPASRVLLERTPYVVADASQETQVTATSPAEPTLLFRLDDSSYQAWDGTSWSSTVPSEDPFTSGVFYYNEITERLYFNDPSVGLVPIRF